MADTLDDRLARILPGGKGVWVPMDHGISGYPETGLESMDSLVEAVISGGADAIVLHKGAPVSYTHLTLPTKRIV